MRTGRIMEHSPADHLTTSGVRAAADNSAIRSFHTMRLVLRLLAVFATCIPPMFCGQRGSTAEEVWELVIRAKGGRAALDGVRTLVISTPAVRSGPEVRIADLTVYSVDKGVWQWSDLAREFFGVSVRSCDFVRGMMRTQTAADLRSNVRVNYEACGSVWGRFLAATYLLATDESARPELIQSGPLHRNYVIRRRTREHVVDYAIDRRTMLPSRVRISKISSDRPLPYATSFRLGEYRTFSGVQLPTKVYDEAGGWRMTYTYEVNPKARSDLFSDSPPLSAGPNAWRE